jgi:hypothetical protein
MLTIISRTLATASLAILASAGIAAAQAAPSPLLNTLEVRALVASANAADNARLAAHFTTLSERYAAEAKRHTAMAQAFTGSAARRGTVATATDHCRRLAQLNTESSQILRDLAAHHEKLAAGAASNVPRGGDRFQAGAGAPEPTDAELAALAAKATTPADHRGLEEYFQAAARRYGADADTHAAMAQAYRGSRTAQAATHCDRLATLDRESAKEASELAAHHKQLAGAAR